LLEENPFFREKKFTDEEMISALTVISGSFTPEFRALVDASDRRALYDSISEFDLTSVKEQGVKPIQVSLPSLVFLSLVSDSFIQELLVDEEVTNVKVLCIIKDLLQHSPESRLEAGTAYQLLKDI
jgi:hypothetical protein